jgi:hypothetical protein
LQPISAIAFVALGIALAETKQGRSPDNFYSIFVATDGEQTETTVKSHTTYSFRSPDGQAAIAISATYNLSLPKVLPRDVLDAAFPKEKGVTGIKHIRGAGWDGLHREYANEDDTKRWIARAARNGSTVVLITMDAPTNALNQFRDTFEKVGNSLRLGQ